MKKQTAVQWLERLLYVMPPSQEYDVKKVLEIAKAMEKEQIIDAYETSHISMMTSEQYFNETYNSL